MTEFLALRAKTNTYLTNQGDENKKARGTKKPVIKRKLKIEDYKNFLEVTQLAHKINSAEKNKLDLESLKKNYKTFIKKQQKYYNHSKEFRSKKNDVFTEEVNKIALSANDDKKHNQFYRKICIWNK